jgi:hypothetical protein
MTISKRTWTLGLVIAAALVAGEIGIYQQVVPVPSLVSEAVARVGRPLTPVSVAGVARRTTRRCATGVYNC